MVILDRESRRIAIFELTCPLDANVNDAHARKEGKYAPLVADLSRSMSVLHFSVEVLVRGQISKPNRSRYKCLAFGFCSEPKGVTRSLVSNSSRAALLGSYSLFSAQNAPSWAPISPLTVR